MPVPDDIAASLPQHPPPSPSRREAAIRLALARFDGRDAEPSSESDTQRPQPAGGWWARVGRPQAGVFATVVLVAAIGIPIAWSSLSDLPEQHQADRTALEVADVAPGIHGYEPSASMTAPDIEAETPLPAAPAAEEAAAETAAKPVLDAPAPESATPAEPVEVPVPPLAIAQAKGRMQALRAPSAAAPPPRLLPPPPPPAAAPAPPSAPALADAAESRTGAAFESEQIVATSRRRETPRGDWNACTVNDPARTIQGCGALIGGKAAADLERGLERAWQGDYAGAIAAFDRVVEAAPGNAFARLNRGLAHQRQGDLDRARADLDEAVRLDPQSARNYYNRSLLLREQGDSRRARQDANRATAIDPGYEGVLR